MTTKERLHRLIATRPEPQLDTAERLLTSLREVDAFAIALVNAPEDDEPETPEEAAAVAEGKAALARGDVHSLTAVRAELLG